MSAYKDPLLQSFQLRNTTFRNRIMSTSHACGLEDDQAMPGTRYQQYHVAKARGGVGLTMFGGSAYVAEDSTWNSGQLNMSTDRIIPYLRSFSSRVKAEGASIMMQITHLGRRGETNGMNWLPTIAPSMVRETGHRSFPRVMDRYDIDRVVGCFGDAAERAKKGGLDGLETMVGGHLIGQFLSLATNHRTDEFGGSLENRCRFGLMVHEEIRNRTGDDFIVGMRLPMDESSAGGLDFKQSVDMAKIFETSGLVDYFNVNSGRIDTELSLVTDCMPGMQSKIAPWLQVAGAFKKLVGLPVFHAAKIIDLATARYAISEGLLDMVAMTRAHIADPEIVNKIQRGEEHRIRPCVGMTHCMGANRPTCAHNPASGREEKWQQTVTPAKETGKRAAVVGGGPAGLEAARVLATRGHQVTLLEAADDVGGQLRMATRADWRKDIAGIIDWRRNEIAELGVDTRFNVLAEEQDVLSLNPDIVILATGGVPDLEWLDGELLCTPAWDILTGGAPVSNSVLVYDGTGRHTALTVADYCKSNGAKVELVLLDDRPASELAYGERVIWKRELASKGISPLVDRRLVRIEQDSDRLLGHFKHELTGVPFSLQADQIIVEHGTIPDDRLFNALRQYASNAGVTDIKALLAGEPQPVTHPKSKRNFTLHRIGDALSSRDVAASMLDALRLCSVM